MVIHHLGTGGIQTASNSNDCRHPVGILESNIKVFHIIMMGGEVEDGVLACIHELFKVDLLF